MKLVPYLVVAVSAAALAPLPLASDRDASIVEATRATAPEHPDVAFDLRSTGIEWSRGLDAALHKKKPVLLFQLLGDFETVHC